MKDKKSKEVTLLRSARGCNNLSSPGRGSDGQVREPREVDKQRCPPKVVTSNKKGEKGTGPITEMIRATPRKGIGHEFVQ